MPVPEDSAPDYDVVVVGGGPAGSTTATLTAMRGRRVLQLERESFPRYQIGESLLPATAHGICQLLEVDEDIRAAGFVTKRGGSFRWGSDPEPWGFSFADSPRLPGPASEALQVQRAQFDHLLLENSRRHGVDVREQCLVRDVIEREGRISGVRYTDAAGEEHTVEATYVVDASGGRSSLHRHVGTRQQSDSFRNHALFGYITGGKRPPGPDGGNSLCAAFDQGWIWYVPLAEDLTGVGVVVDAKSGLLRGSDSEAVLWSLIERCDPVRELLTDAQRVTEGMYGEIRMRPDYSYLSTEFWRPGMVLVGDAAGFLEPVFSTGVHLATYAGLLAARSINSVLDEGQSEERAFGEFEGRYRREYLVLSEFLRAFSDQGQSTDSLLRQARETVDLPMSDAEAFATLVSGVSSGEAALTGTEETREVRALLPGGLVPSTDGRSWAEPS